jgi:hypothetical protein
VIVGLVALAGCWSSRVALVRELAQPRCAGVIRVTSQGLDDDTGAEVLRADACGETTFYQCWSHPRSARSCCEPIGAIGRLSITTCTNA